MKAWWPSVASFLNSVNRQGYSLRLQVFYSECPFQANYTEDKPAARQMLLHGTDKQLHLDLEKY